MPVRDIGNDRIGWRGNPPAVAGTKNGPLLILGCGRTLWDDLEIYDRRHTGARMAVNQAGLHYRGYRDADGAWHHARLDHWASMHPERNLHFQRFRRQLIDEFETPLHSHRHIEGVRYHWPLDNLGGTSGLFAIFVGLLMGYAPVILAGMPMTGDGHYYDSPHWSPERDPLACTHYRYDDRANTLAWNAAREQVFAGRVFSLSGRTRDWLGPPPDLAAAA